MSMLAFSSVRTVVVGAFRVVLSTSRSGALTRCELAMDVACIGGYVVVGFWRRQAPAGWHLCCAPDWPQCGVGVSVTLHPIVGADGVHRFAPANSRA